MHARNSVLLITLCLLTGYFTDIYGQKQSYIDSIYQLPAIDTFLEKLFIPKKEASPYIDLWNRLLEKAKQKNDVSKQADYYYLLGGISTKEIGRMYLDSIIELTKDSNDYNYPAKAYKKRATYYASEIKYELAIQELTKANALNIERKNKDEETAVNYFIALLKDIIGEKKESLKIQQSTILSTLGDSYYQNKIYDSAYSISAKGIKLMQGYSDSLFYNRFLLSAGMAHFGKKEYNKAIDSLLKYKKVLSAEAFPPINFIAPDMYLGMSYYQNGSYDKALPILTKADSLIFAIQDFHPNQRPVFELLLEYYKKAGDTENQLLQISRLISFDSIITLNYKNIRKEIALKYETPNLIAQKQQLINKLEKNNHSKKTYLWVFGLLCVIFLSLFAWNYTMKNIYKKSKDSSEDLKIPKEVIENTLDLLEKFELEKGFLENSISINGIAKNLGTNSRYLSKIVNTFKEKTFSNYVNDLRVDYAIKRLRDETNFRNFKMIVIAHESGFNTSQAFSKSFYKKTGVQPSFFIKELSKNVA